ncbi:MAG: hypothetical protein KKB50_00400, partial [Planctomycetes bacterium]|nr:hypothetical protein [Planctomycetota bacterium]
MSRYSVAVAGWLACATSATFADNFIREWGGASGGYEINQFQRTVLITTAGTFKFDAMDGAALGVIDLIEVQTGVTGTVNLHIRRGPGPGELPVEGAQDVKEINLSNATIGNIAELRIAGDLGEVNNIVADNITGTFNVAGDVLHMIDVEDDVTGAI